MSSIFDAIDEGDDPFGTEPTAYDLHVARAREERQLQAQVRKYGDNEMRVEPKVAVGSGGALSTEPFERSYQLRMPGSAARKSESTDPLRSLMKAMNISGNKRPPAQGSGRKEHRTFGLGRAHRTANKTT